MLSALKEFVRNRWVYHTHWPSANYAHVAQLAERTKSFPPTIRILFFQFVAGSCSIVDTLLSPAKGRHRIIKKDAREITTEQFQELHHLLIWALLGLFLHLNPQYRGPMTAACFDFIGNAPRSQRMFDWVIQLKKFDVGAICAVLWPEILDVLHEKQEDELQWVLLTPFLSGAFTRAVGNFKNEISKLGSA